MHQRLLLKGHHDLAPPVVCGATPGIAAAAPPYQLRQRGHTSTATSRLTHFANVALQTFGAAQLNTQDA